MSELGKEVEKVMEQYERDLRAAYDLGLKSGYKLGYSAGHADGLQEAQEPERRYSANRFGND